MLLCMVTGVLNFPVESFGAEIPGNTEIFQNKREELYDSLEPVCVLELKPENISSDKKEEKAGVYSLQASEWTKYASTYFYEQLSEEEKAFWMGLNQQCSEYLLSNKNVEKVEAYYALPKVEYTGLTFNRARQVYQLFRYSNPQYYFLGNAVYHNSESKVVRLCVFEEFAKGTSRAAATARVKYQIGEMMEEINGEKTDLMKEKMAHDLICEKVDYDSNHNNEAKNKFNQGIYSVFCTDTTVCAGYSQAMQLLMNGAGIQCAIVTSKTHAWNMVLLGGNWYYTDLTWDDGKDNWLYTYFNRSREKMLEIDGTGHREESYLEEYLPGNFADSQVMRTDVPSIQMINGHIVMSSEGGDIYYTLDAHTPFRLKNAVKYENPIPVKRETDIVAVASKKGCFESMRKKFSIYQVNFLLEGSPYGEPLLLPEGEKIPQPVPGRREGYVFTGWHIDPACTVSYHFESPVKGSITLYGGWRKDTGGTDAGGTKNPSNAENSGEESKLFPAVPVSYKVTYHANGGYIGKKSVSTQECFVTNRTVYGSQPKARRKDYVFLGWYTKKGKGQKIKDTDVAELTGDTTFYAHWGKVNPRKAAISSVKSRGEGEMTLKIKQVKSASGYQIRYSTSPSMESAKKIKSTDTKNQIQGLKRGKKYYVQVRMFQKESVSGKVYYGEWSGKKSVKIKKK